MEVKKTKIVDFIKYLEINQLAPARVLSALKFIEGKYYEAFNNIDYIEDIELINFLIMRNTGKKSWFAFEELREYYVQNVKPKELESKCENENKKSYCKGSEEEIICRMSSEIVQTLKKIDNSDHFIEMAILEKFERDGIRMVEIIKNDITDYNASVQQAVWRNWG